jgi:hypothetical protein
MIWLKTACFRCSLWLWAKYLPLAIRGQELMPLLERVKPPGRQPYSGIAAAEILKRVKLACRKPWLMRDRRCLREGLLAFRFLSMAGYHPVLRFGVERTSLGQSSLSAHCWIDLDGTVALNPPTPGMVEILAWRGDSGGARAAAAARPTSEVM